MHDTMFLSSAFTIAKCNTRINICSTPSWSPQILHMFGWCAAARAPALIAAVGLRRVPPSPPPPWFRPPARAALRLWSPRCASAAPLHKNNRRSTSLALKKKKHESALQNYLVHYRNGASFKVVGVLTVQTCTPPLQRQHPVAVLLPGEQLLVLGGWHGVELFLPVF